MSYLITGGAGFIGSHVAERLLARDEKVVIIDNFNNYYDPAIKRANVARIKHQALTVIEGDIRDADLVKRLFDEHEVKRVAHLAAMAGVRSSVTDVPLYMQVNTMGAMNLFEAAHHSHVEQFVLASTSSVYGATKVLPFIETDTADRPLAAYPASKRAAELLAYTYHNLHKQNYTILRFFNVYGPAGRPDMMPMRVMHASQDGSEVKIFNGGNISRDWTYIDDTVDGVIAALDKPLGYEIINLGVGNPISLTEFLEVIEELSGKVINKVNVPAPLTEPPITYCDNTKARELLGFAPKVSVHEGLAKTWAWFREYYGL